MEPAAAAAWHNGAAPSCSLELFPTGNNIFLYYNKHLLRGLKRTVLGSILNWGKFIIFILLAQVNKIKCGVEFRHLHAISL